MPTISYRTHVPEGLKALAKGEWRGSSQGAAEGGAGRFEARLGCFLRKRTKLGWVDDDAIRALVIRLSRPDVSGGDTIERAAILAEGSDLAAVVAWILARGGKPEAAVAVVSARGLHSSRLSGSDGTQTSAPLRYVLPAGSLG